jgi:hypothetical protein
LDGSLLFAYLLTPVSGAAEATARVTVMHLNDCVRRIEMIGNVGGADDEIATLEGHRAKFSASLEGNAFF